MFLFQLQTAQKPSSEFIQQNPIQEKRQIASSAITENCEIYNMYANSKQIDAKDWQASLSKTSNKEVFYGELKIGMLKTWREPGKDYKSEENIGFSVLLGKPSSLQVVFPDFNISKDGSRSLDKNSDVFQVPFFSNLAGYFPYDYFQDKQGISAVVSGTFGEINYKDAITYPCGLMKVNGKEYYPLRSESINDENSVLHKYYKKIGATSSWTSVFYIDHEGKAGIIKSSEASRDKISSWKDAVEIGVLLVKDSKSQYPRYIDDERKNPKDVTRMAIVVTPQGDVGFVKTFGDMTKTEFASMLEGLGFKEAALLDGNKTAQMFVKMADGKEKENADEFARRIRPCVQLFAFKNKGSR